MTRRFTSLLRRIVERVEIYMPAMLEDGIAEKIDQMVAELLGASSAIQP